jgi:hypothetical protein
MMARTTAGRPPPNKRGAIAGRHFPSRVHDFNRLRRDFPPRRRAALRSVGMGVLRACHRVSSCFFGFFGFFVFLACHRISHL